MATALDPLPFKLFEKAAKSALGKLFPATRASSIISELTEPQSRSAFQFLSGHDTFVSLPTGHGKSLIYQICPLIAQELAAVKTLDNRFPSHPMLVVISPLNSLIADQISSCERMGLKACKVELESTAALQNDCDYQLLYASPEIFENEDARRLLQTYCDRIIGVVVDESHCIVQWGTGEKKGEKPFREAYGKIGHLRGFTKAPFLCLTATASSQVRKKIIKSLNMKNTKVVRLSPDKKNLFYSVKKCSDIEETLQPMVKELSEKTIELSKTIIYCRSLKDCGEIYSLFDSPHIAMYHSRTPEKIKEQVLESVTDDNGKCRIVIATSALGMGVDIHNVRRIIHYGIPHDLESYVQEVGRGGRDGKPCEAILYYRPFHMAHCDEHMRSFIKNAENKCRRQVIMSYFKEKLNKPDSIHNCCDACRETCDCATCKKEQLSPEPTVMPEPLPSLSRSVEEDDRELLRELLKEIPTKTGPASSVFGCAKLSIDLDEELVNSIASNCQYIFSIDYIMDNFPVFNKQVAKEILTIVDEIFNDIDEGQFLITMDESLINDMLFLNVEEQAYDSDSEEFDSDY